MSGADIKGEENMALREQLVQALLAEFYDSPITNAQLLHAIAEAEKHPATLLEKIVALVRKPELELVESLRGDTLPRGANGLIHGTLRDPREVLARFRARCSTRGVRGKFTWIGSSEPPPFDPHDPEVAVVLEGHLASLPATFALAYELAREGNRLVLDNGSSLYNVNDDPRLAATWERIHLTEEGWFKPKTLRWRLVKINSNANVDPAQASHPTGQLPGLASLFLLGQHPERFKASTRPGRTFYLRGISYKHDAPIHSLVAQIVEGSRSGYQTSHVLLGMRSLYSPAVEVMTPTILRA